MNCSFETRLGTISIGEANEKRDTVRFRNLRLSIAQDALFIG